MSVFKTTFSRALPIIIGPDAVIPTPYLLNAGDTTQPSPYELINNDVDFLALGIKVGDVVYNPKAASAATITSISENVLGLNANIFTAVGTEQYEIYQQSAASGIGNQGCNVWVDADTNLTVITLGGDQVDFIGIKGGTVLPVQVIQVLESTAAENLIALW